MKNIKFKLISLTLLTFLASSFGFANPVHRYVIDGDLVRLQAYLHHHPMSLTEFMAEDENQKTTMELAVASGNDQMMEFVSSHALWLKRAQKPIREQQIRAQLQPVHQDGLFAFDEELINPDFFKRN